MHTDENRDPEVWGTIRGMPEGLRNWGPIAVPLRLKPGSLSLRGVYAIGLLFALAMTAYGLARPALYAFFPLGRQIFGWKEALRIDWGLVLLGSFYAVMIAWVLWTGRRRFPRSLQISE